MSFARPLFNPALLKGIEIMRTDFFFKKILIILLEFDNSNSRGDRLETPGRRRGRNSLAF